jgi:hypothetical protein
VQQGGTLKDLFQGKSTWSYQRRVHSTKNMRGNHHPKSRIQRQKIIHGKRSSEIGTRHSRWHCQRSFNRVWRQTNSLSWQKRMLSISSPCSRWPESDFLVWVSSSDISGRSWRSGDIRSFSAAVCLQRTNMACVIAETQTQMPYSLPRLVGSRWVNPSLPQFRMLQLGSGRTDG